MAPLLSSVMTPATKARRWKLTALASLALLIGYVAGQLTPSATAQQSVTRVQLDTSNCRTGATEWYLANVPEGAVVTEIVGGGSEVTFIHFTCD